MATSSLIYRELAQVARRCSALAAEAEDLIQDAMLEAITSGRHDLEVGTNRSWVAGVIRNKARLAARTAGRRRKREGQVTAPPSESEVSSPKTPVAAVLPCLPPALRLVAALALSGHDRREIGHLLGLSDTALRQRVSALRKRLAALGTTLPPQGLTLNLAYGRIRDALLPLLARRGGDFATHDPDGHLLVIRRR
jgi:RNA polymerase sigma factor (sigma-70 family)